MPEDVAVETVEQQPTPTLGEAWAAQNLGTGAEDKPRKQREENHGRNTHLVEEEDTSRSLANSPESTRVPKKEQSLSDAYSGIAPEDDEIILQDDLPSSLQGFSADDVGAMMLKFGLSADDLKDPRWVGALADALEQLEPSEEEGAEEAADEEKPEENKDEKPEEEKKPAPVHAELQPEEVKKYVEATYLKSEQINSPQMTKLFADSLAGVLGTTPENRELLDNVVGLLNYGGVSLVQSAMPAMIDEFMQEHFVPNMMRNIGPLLEAYLPGITASHHSSQARSVWNEVRAEADQFAALPDFDSKSFSDLRDKIRQENPWIDTWSGGKDLTPQQDLRARAQLFARLAAGDRVNPKAITAQIADALQLGKKSAERSTRKVTANGALGRGRSSGSIGEQKERSGLLEAWNEKHGRDKDGI